MNGYNKGEGHGSGIWCSYEGTSRMRYNNQTMPRFVDLAPVDNVRTSDSFQNLSHADVIPVSTHANFDVSVQLPKGDSAVDLDFSDAVLKYINHILLEEDLEEETLMFRESAAHQAAEKSLFEVIGKQYPAATDYQYGSNLDKITEKSDENLSGVNDCISSCDSGTFRPDWNPDFDCDGLDICHDTAKEIHGRLLSLLMLHQVAVEPRFKKGVEEASKFFPNGRNLVAALGYDGLLPKEDSADLSVKVDNKIGNDEVVDNLRGKKNPYHESMGLEEERSNKQSAVFSESTVSSDMFDRGSSGGKIGGKKKQGKRNVVDMRTLLTLCAQAVAADDRRTANELLKQIRQHAAPSGDGMQRLAHFFADGLEARMAGSGTQIYTSILSLPTSAADVLKAYHTYLATCPFRKITNFFANKTILNVSEKAMKLHIIDFGVLYGFQWPSFLQKLSRRPGGPPKLRITGVDFPIPGFRPSMRVEETGRRLASYAKTFGVPFEFHAIAQKWETIKLEDLKIQKDEMVAVNSHFNLKNLLD
ncbi:hypothetical protein SASPL_139003 [Salvia splendens]|uniref:DELLA protein n=1 Tax=Salvia splendens TaxID=180675 RepID=A0A8X8WXM1_SALSN|nr:hypothetical protein SASPL_139003 [Salvia splendens]